MRKELRARSSPEVFLGMLDGGIDQGNELLLNYASEEEEKKDGGKKRSLPPMPSFCPEALLFSVRRRYSLESFVVNLRIRALSLRNDFVVTNALGRWTGRNPKYEALVPAQTLLKGRSGEGVFGPPRSNPGMVGNPTTWLATPAPSPRPVRPA